MKKVVQTYAHGEDDDEIEEAERQLKNLRDAITWLESEGLADVFILKTGLERLISEAGSRDDTDERYNYVIKSGNELERYEDIMSQEPADLDEYNKKVAAWKEKVKKAKEEGKTFYE